MEEKSLAYELLQEVKHTNKRLFVICIVELVMILSMVISFLIYESQFNYSVTDEQVQSVENIDSSEVSQVIN